MVYRTPTAAPVSRISAERQGRRLGKFCSECGSVFSLHAARHKGKPMYGKDHVSAPCSHEGDLFDPAEDWWEPAVEVLPAPPEAAPDSAA